MEQTQSSWPVKLIFRVRKVEASTCIIRAHADLPLTPLARMRYCVGKESEGCAVILLTTTFCCQISRAAGVHQPRLPALHSALYEWQSGIAHERH